MTRRSSRSHDGDNARYHLIYEESKHTCENIIRFIECLPVPSGAMAGENQFIKLLPWQKELIKNVWPKRGRNKSEVLLCIARRNGKTVFLAALMAFLLFNRHEKSKPAPGSLLVSAANNKEQASLVWEILATWCSTVIELNEASEPNHFFRTIDVLTSKGTKFKSLASGAKQALGGNYAVIFCDEVGFFRDNKLPSALRSGMGSTPASKRLFLQASTVPEDRTHFFFDEVSYFAERKDSPRHYALVAMADPRFDAPEQESTWRKSNPSYGKLIHKESFVEEWESSKDFPQRRQGFCAYRCNMPIGLMTTDAASFVTSEVWDKCEGKSELTKGEQIVVAWDAASTQDLTAIVAMSVSAPHRTWCRFIVPKQTVAKHKHIPYTVWQSEGYCEICPTEFVSKQFIVDEYVRLQREFDLVASQSDRYGYPEIARLAEEQGIDLTRHIARHPNKADYHDGLHKLSDLIKQKQLVHDNKVLSFCVKNMKLKRNRDGSAVVDRELSIKRGMKIDGGIALLLTSLLIAGKTMPTTELTLEGLVL